MTAIHMGGTLNWINHRTAGKKRELAATRKSKSPKPLKDRRVALVHKGEGPGSVELPDVDLVMNLIGSLGHRMASCVTDQCMHPVQRPPTISPRLHKKNLPRKLVGRRTGATLPSKLPDCTRS